MKQFPKDDWIKAALRAKYLVVEPDGTIWRANRADKNGVVNAERGYSRVTPQIHKASGRVYFNMTYRGFTKSVLVNRVVAWAFLPNPDNLPQVNHIDGDKENNAVANLEWASGSDNERHAHRTGLKTGRGSANSNAKLTANDVLAIRSSNEHPEALAERYGVKRSTIENVLKRRTWTHL